MKIAISIIATLLGVTNGAKDHCYALTMAGGGTKGAYEAGVLWGMIDAAQNKSEYAYDVVCGVSAGSINTAGVALFAPGDELNMTNTLSSIWSAITTKDIFKMWRPFGIVSGFSKYGLVDTSPLRNVIQNVFNKYGSDYKRKVGLAAVNVANGNYEVFDETLDEQDKINAVMSSSAFPFAFPAQHWNFKGDDLLAMDGWTAWNLNLASAITRCKEIVGDDESKITLDVVDVGTNKLAPYTHDEHSNTLNNWNRFQAIKSYNDDAADIAEIMAAFPKVNFRHVVGPSQELGSASSMDGTNATCTWPMQLIGRRDGANAVKNGEGYMHGKMMEWTNSVDLQQNFPKLADYIVSLNSNTSQDEDIPISCKLSLNLFSSAAPKDEFLQK